MNVFILSIPNELERKRNIRIQNGFDEFVCLLIEGLSIIHDLSNSNTIFAKKARSENGYGFHRPGLKTGQDLENLAAHPHQEFPGVPPREKKL